jgi:hypothetical protein
MLKKTCFHTLLSASVLAAGIAFAPVSVQAEADNTYKWDSFEDIDVNRSGYLENGEYKSYAFGKADWDNDGYLEDSEWVAYTEVYYDPWELEYESYTQYDTDGDGFIDRTEFNEVPTVGLYDAWDYDNDNLINDNDWDKVTTYYYDQD